VQRTLGPGFREITYQRALALELEANGLDFVREEDIPVYYKNREIDKRRVDFVVEDCLVEIKAKSEFDPEDYIGRRISAELKVLRSMRASGATIAKGRFRRKSPAHRPRQQLPSALTRCFRALRVPFRVLRD
jgi:GxxExxY protein